MIKKKITGILLLLVFVQLLLPAFAMNGNPEDDTNSKMTLGSIPGNTGKEEDTLLKDLTKLKLSDSTTFVNSHSEIDSFLSFLTKMKKFSIGSIAKKINAYVGIDSRIPHPLDNKASTLGFKINKHTWPTSLVIKDFTMSNHCKGSGSGIKKREYLWEVLKKIYEKELDEYKKSSHRRTFVPLPSKLRKTKEKKSSSSSQDASDEDTSDKNVFSQVINEDDTIGWVSQKEQDEEERKDELRELGFDSEEDY